MASTIADRVRAAATVLLPFGLRQLLRAQQRRLGLHRTPIGGVTYGDLRRLTPISPVFGIDRGLPIIDRYYIEGFLARHAGDISGRVLEMGDAAYTRRFGGDRVTQSDVLHYVPDNPEATIVGDLTTADHIHSDSFDCIILTQTLQMILDIRAALHHLHRILKPGGVLLGTSHGISRIARREGIDPWGEYWRFTAQSTRHLFGALFPADNLQIVTYGNVLSAAASLYGLAAADLTMQELDYCDANFEVIIAVRAQKPIADARAVVSDRHE
jgi:SAM-dependent methyltransferase